MQAIIHNMEQREKALPGTVPSIRAMIIDFMKEKLNENITEVKIEDIYIDLENRIQAPIFAGRFKKNTFRNSIRGEINHNELQNTEKRSMQLFERVERGVYKLTQNGLNYTGR